MINRNRSKKNDKQTGGQTGEHREREREREREGEREREREREIDVIQIDVKERYRLRNIVRVTYYMRLLATRQYLGAADTSLRAGSSG